MKKDSDTNCKCHAWNGHQRTDIGTEGFENKRTSRDHPNHTNFEISQNNTPGDLRRLADA